jgi:hypothetical protein
MRRAAVNEVQAPTHAGCFTAQLGQVVVDGSRCAKCRTVDFLILAWHFFLHAR